jgi:hypothetical protein
MTREDGKALVSDARHFDQVADRLRKALGQLLNEPKLFEFKVNERTLTQRLSLHLQPLFQGLSVDCEYNRYWQEGEGRDLPNLHRSQSLLILGVRQKNQGGSTGFLK